MADANENKVADEPVDVGMIGARSSRGISATEIIALTLSGFWLLACAVFFLVLGGADPSAGDALRFVMVMIAVALPVALIWLAAVAVRSARVMRAESERTRAALNTMRHSYLEMSRSHALAPTQVHFEKKLDEIAQSQRHTETAIATFASARPNMRQRLAAPAPEPKLVGPALSTDEAGQTSLALGTPSEALAEPIEVDDLIRAVNFPESADDTEGFAALRRALTDRKVASLIQAAQDILTLLAQDGIYMDDLRPDRARPDVWRRFAQGTRGREIAGLGGVRDRSSLALAAGRMKHDTIFRDAAHHFLRRFDEVISAVEPRASDEELARLCDTRTARAFMLLGRVTGTFD